MTAPLAQIESLTGESSNTVVVTGFGPFHKHPINASWEAVQLLPGTGIEEDLGISLIVEQIPVSYEEVETRIPKLWQTHKPLLVIHVGVSEKARKITLEQIAAKSGYTREDICGCKPTKNECCFGESSVLCSSININQLSQEINSTSEIETCTSNVAGRYLCEYIYYTSLSMDSGRSLFIHVPPLNQPYTAEQLAKGLSDVIRFLVKELRNKSKEESVNLLAA